MRDWINDKHLTTTYWTIVINSQSGVTALFPELQQLVYNEFVLKCINLPGLQGLLQNVFV